MPLDGPGGPHCGGSATMAAYKTGVAYAAERIAELAPSVVVYLGTGHSGWLLEEQHAGLCEIHPGRDVAQRLGGISSNMAGRASERVSFTRGRSCLSAFVPHTFIGTGRCAARGRGWRS